VSVTAAPVEPAARAKEPTTRRSPRRAIGALIAFAAVVGAFITGAVLMRSPGPTPPPPEESTEPPTVVADQTEPAEEPAPNAAAGSRADEALGEYLVARRAADDIGAATWGGEAYEQAAALAATADEAFLEERYDDAARSYEEASAAFGSVAATSGEAHVRLMREGAEAIERFDAAAATAAFEAALLIVPDDQIARRDLTRAGTLDEVNRLLTSGREHEDDGRFSLAYVDFAAARQLDPHSTAAAEAERRTKDALADEQFRAMMASALEAYHRDDFEAARAGLLEAKRFRGAVPEIEEALTMVAEGERRHTIGQLKQHATDHEKLEEYQKAWQTYRQALKLDPNIEFAQEGRVRCERMIQAVQQTRHFLDNPALLEKRGTREQALVFSQELEKMPDKGPKLAKDSAELAEKVRLANTPLRVVLRSDGKTEVDVYRVGRYGAFQSKELQLLPGEYTVVGHRPGYKDVRRALRVKHGEGQMSLEIVCREAI
jgi:tetratricopeptide (TPR) repeat protein